MLVIYEQETFTIQGVPGYGPVSHFEHFFCDLETNFLSVLVEWLVTVNLSRMTC